MHISVFCLAELLIGRVCIILCFQIFSLIIIEILRSNFILVPLKNIVLKFKKKPQFLEFIVRVLQKAISENIQEQAIEWCKEVNDWLEKCDSTFIIFSTYSYEYKYRII